MHHWPSKKVIKTWSLWRELPRGTEEERAQRNDLLINFGLKPEPKTMKSAVDKSKKTR